MNGDQGPADSEGQDWVYHVASQLAGADLPDYQAEERRRRRRIILFAGIAAATVLGVVATAVLMDGGDDGSTTTGPAPTEADTMPADTTTADTTTADSVPVATTLPEASTSTTTSATTAAPTTTTVSATTTVAAVPASSVAPETSGAPVRWADFVGGVVYLRGSVPDEATAEEIASKAAAVVGDQNVRVEYTVDPAAARPESAPLYVKDSILFAAESSELNAKARETLDLGVSLLALYPQVTFDISGHTDSLGADSVNLALSQLRVDAIVAYITSKGIDASRLTAVAKGEAEPIADNATPEGRAKNRRIEIQVNNLLG